MNEKFEVLTIRDIQFTDQKTNREISGMQLWVIGQSQDKSWNGWEVLKIWIDFSSSMVSDVQQLRRGDNIQVAFGRNGKARMITLLP